MQLWQPTTSRLALRGPMRPWAAAATPASSLLDGLVAAWSYDAADATTRDSTYPTGDSKLTLTQGGTVSANATGGLIGGRVSSADGTANRLYLNDANIANAAQFTIAGWYRFPGIDATNASLRGPYLIRCYAGSGSIRMYFRGPYFSAGSPNMYFYGGYYEADPAGAKVVTIVNGRNITGATAEIENWFLVSIRYNGTTITYDYWSSADHQTKTATPSGGLTTIASNRIYVFPADVISGADTNEADNLVIASRAWSDAELSDFYAAGAGKQYPFS